SHRSCKFIQCRRLEDLSGRVLRCSAVRIFALPIKKWCGAVEAPGIVDLAALAQGQVPFGIRQCRDVWSSNERKSRQRNQYSSSGLARQSKECHHQKNHGERKHYGLSEVAGSKRHSQTKNRSAFPFARTNADHQSHHRE